ncbi:uncharacterized protein CELE_ZK688.4 [Caenorhabditis elegans]|uniref:Uncharacterized protein ZK688.4 n=1 Tax=Caenorhabditis elegans TaxID=6239 RepID=YO24_CAEEL|nr:Uncharacterized protein CELE_ZK688.4 [Caenorhabditis elegans]P34674.1 RecName: Full=Uncharacterized protein ZK688.4 [Caenorhabditis elegans]CCD62535.1 Uncharacterized protein CELE_ZK688.4 [Caenorhabditis elegans]|eukprot:NP_498716.1 Uncharacterized protein CELE_ZK688.4 [Caenorhabditis elegans]
MHTLILFRTVHSVSNFYIFSSTILLTSAVILAIFFFFGDGFFREKYRREFSTNSKEKDGNKNLTTVE